VTGLSFSPDGLALASAGRGGKVLLWDLAPLASEDDADAPASQTLVGHAGSVWDLAFNADNRTVATAGGEGQVVLWDRTGEHPLARGFAKIPDAFPDALDAAISPDGRTLAVAGVSWDRASGASATIIDQWVWLYDMTTEQPLEQLDTNNDTAAVTFSHDGRRLFSASYSGRVIRVWDVDRDSAAFGQSIETPALVHSRAVTWLTVSPGGGILASGGEDTTLLWDSMTYQPIGRLVPDQPIPDKGLAFSPDGMLLATGGTDRVIRLWEVDGQELTNELGGVHEEVIKFIAFSPDGERLFSASDTEFYVWDLTVEPPAARLLRAQGYTEFDVRAPGDIQAMVFDATGRYLVTAPDDEVIIFWDAPPLQVLGPLISGFPYGLGLRGQVIMVGTPDGSAFVTVDRSGLIQLWEFNLEGWLERACQRANRNMTPDEWQQLFGDEPYRLTCPNLPLPATE
jgi:WD40 repeat protein